MKRIVKKINRDTQKRIPLKKDNTDKKIILAMSAIKQKHKPLINIITRTAGRPNSFKRCCESIKNQTYINIRHIISIDNIEDKLYVQEETNDFIFIDKTSISNAPDIPNPNTGSRFIYNLYFNILFKHVNNGWILILDDDDFLADKNSVQDMVDKITSSDDMLLWQMRYNNGNLLPMQFSGKPRLGQIGSPCIMIHSDIAKTIKWDGWKCGDYRYISKAWDKTKDKKWINKPLIQLGGVGFGLKKDIIINQPLPSKITNVQVKKPLPSKITNVQVKKPLPSVNISILITAYKSQDYIEACLDSIERQTYFKNNNDYEVIVGVDSCQPTYKKLLAIKNKYRNLTIVMMAKNKGTYITMNTLLPMVNYSNIIRFDSDDIMKEHMVAKIISVSNNADIVRFRFTTFRVNTINPVVRESGKIPAVGVLFLKRKVFDIAGGYVNSRFSSDSELIVRTSKFVRTIELPDQLFFYRSHINSLSKTVSRVERKAFDDITRSTKYTKDNIKITPVVNTISKVIKNKDFNQELKIFINRIKNNIPFSIVRYGDGEAMIIENIRIDLTKKFNGEHIYDPMDIRHQRLRDEMTQSIQYSDNTYFVGLPCPCCVNKKDVDKILALSKQKENNLTWANIFVNSNFKIFNSYFFNEIKNKDIVLICHEKADTTFFKKGFNIIKEFRVGVNAWLNDYNKIGDIVNYSQTVKPNTVFLFMAGTFTKLAIYKIHKTRKDLFLLDLGSTLDVKLNLGKTRGYLNNNVKNINKKCKWLTQ